MLYRNILELRPPMSEPIATSDEFATAMQAIVDLKLARSRRVTLEEVDARSLPGKVRDGVARLFSPYL